MLRFHIHTIDRLRGIEKTLIFGYLEFIPKIIKIYKKINTSLFRVSSHELAVQISYSYVAPFLRSSAHKHTHPQTHIQIYFLYRRRAFL